MKLRLLVTVFALCASSTALAVPMIAYVERNVEVGNDSDGPFPGPNSPSFTDGLFSDSVTQTLDSDTGSGTTVYDASATQDSNIDPSGTFTAAGAASIDFEGWAPDNPYANSAGLVQFSLLSSHLFTATGTASIFFDGGAAEAGYILFGPSLTPIVFALASLGSPVAINDSVLLGAGDYLLAFGGTLNSNVGGAFMGGDAQYDLTFTFTQAVPEPGTFALFGLGLLAAQRRRRMT